MTKEGAIRIKPALTAKHVELGFRRRGADAHIAGVGAVDISSAVLPLLGRRGDGLAPKGCRTKSRDHKIHAKTSTASRCLGKVFHYDFSLTTVPGTHVLAAAIPLIPRSDKSCRYA